MIFAAGFGTRMRPLTNAIPKPMIPVAGKPMIDHAIAMVRQAGIERIVCNVHYLADVIAPHLREQGVHVVEETPDILDTGGGLRAALPELGTGPVLTLNPDAAWSGANPVEELLAAWHIDMTALLLLQPLDRATGREGGGDFEMQDGHLTRGGDYVYAGAQILRTDRLKDFREAAFSLNRYWDLLAEDGPLHGTTHDGGWCDIGHPEGLKHAETLMRGA